MYRRATRPATLQTLPPAIADALQAHARDHQLPLDPSRTQAWVTESHNPEATGLLGRLLGRRANPHDPDARHDTALLILPTHLVVVTAGERRGATALSLPLLLASVVRGSAMAKRLAQDVPGADQGMTLSGLPGHEGRPGTYFVGLDDGPQGEACFRAVESAIAAARAGAR